MAPSLSLSLSLLSRDTSDIHDTIKSRTRPLGYDLESAVSRIGQPRPTRKHLIPPNHLDCVLRCLAPSRSLVLAFPFPSSAS